MSSHRILPSPLITFSILGCHVLFFCNLFLSEQVKLFKERVRSVLFALVSLMLCWAPIAELNTH